MTDKPPARAESIPAKRLPVDIDRIRVTPEPPATTGLIKSDSKTQTFSEAGLRGWVFTEPPPKKPPSP